VHQIFVQYESLEILVSKQCSLTDELCDEIIGDMGFLFGREYPMMQSMDCAIVRMLFLVQRPFVVSVADGRRWNTKLSSHVS
jgi:hypothetical protein